MIAARKGTETGLQSGSFAIRHWIGDLPEGGALCFNAHGYPHTVLTVGPVTGRHVAGSERTDPKKAPQGSDPRLEFPQIGRAP